MSLDAFLAWERKQERPFEFDGFAPVAMNGGTVAHSEIATNVVEALRRGLRDGPCRVVRGDVKVVVAGRVRYPDVAVTCSPVTSDADILPEPVVIFEVLSRSSSAGDHQHVAGDHQHVLAAWSRDMRRNQAEEHSQPQSGSKPRARSAAAIRTRMHTSSTRPSRIE